MQKRLDLVVAENMRWSQQALFLRALACETVTIVVSENNWQKRELKISNVSGPYYI